MQSVEQTSYFKIIKKLRWAVILVTLFPKHKCMILVIQKNLPDDTRCSRCFCAVNCWSESKDLGELGGKFWRTQPRALVVI